MKLETWLDKIISFSFLALFTLVPLILTPYNYELFEFNKMLTVYFFTVIIAAAWISKMILQKKLIFIRTPFDIPLLLFLLSQILSTIFSLDRHTSFWGYYSRFNGGLASTLCYVILFYAFVNCKLKIENYLRVIVITAVVVAGYGVLEHFGIDETVWIQDVKSRVFSTLGQPNWLAAWLLAILPVSGWFSPLLLLAIFFTRSQSGLLATAIIIVFAGIFWLVQKRYFKILLLALILTISLIYNFRQRLITSLPLGDLNPLVAQESQGRLGGSSSILIRRVVWQGAIAVWRRYPLFGSGVETFAYSYYNFRPANHNLLSEWDFLYNKAHNEFLNFLATTGAFGLTTYLAFIITALIFFSKHPSGLGLGFVSILITNFFGFSVVPVSLLFFLFPAFAYSLTLKPQPLVKKYYFLNNTQSIFIILTALISVYLLFFIAKMWRADRFFTLGRNLIQQNQVQTGFTYLEKSVQLSPYEPLFRSEYGEGLAKLAYLIKDQNATQAAQLAQAAINQSDLVLQANPVHLNYWKSRIKIFLVLSLINPQYQTGALDANIKAIELAPTDAKLYYNLGLIYNQLGQTGLAEQTLKQAIELKPNYETAREQLEKLQKKLEKL